MRKIKAIYGIAALFLVLLLAGCGGSGEKVSLDDSAQAEQQQNNEVNDAEQTAAPKRLALVSEVNGTDVYSGVGSFVANKEVAVGVKIGGTIVSSPLEEGDRVNTNSLVVQVDTEDFELNIKNAKAQLAVAEANLKNANNEYERKKSLYKDGAISESIFEQYETGLELARAQKDSAIVAVEMAEKALKDTTVKAGVNGVVSKVMLEKGEYPDKGAIAAVISVLDPIKLNLSIPQSYAAQIRVGSEVIATLSAYPGEQFIGKVTLVQPNLDPVTRTVMLEAEFDNSDNRIKPGFFAEYEVKLNKVTRTFVVPREALIENGNSYQVIISTEEGEKAVSVILIQHLGNSSKVTGNLEDGEMVVLDN